MSNDGTARSHTSFGVGSIDDAAPHRRSVGGRHIHSERASEWYEDPSISDLFEGGPPYRNGHAIFDQVASRHRGGEHISVANPWTLGFTGDSVDFGVVRVVVERRHTLVWVMAGVGLAVAVGLMWWL